MIKKRWTANKSCEGFTLIEMMIVIAIITIISYWAVPGIKKAYEDFTFHRNTKIIDTIYNSVRSYYLIENEFPPDTNARGKIPNVMAWCIPSCYYKRGKTYYFNHEMGEKQIVEKDEGSVLQDVKIEFDIDNWFKAGTDNENFSFYLNLRQDGDANNSSWANSLHNKYPCAPIIIERGVGLGYPEVNKEFVKDFPAVYRNRFY